MKKPSTNEVSFEERIVGISTAVLVLMSQELQSFIDRSSISHDDFQFVLRWFKDWKFDVPFALAKHNFFESGVDYDDAKDVVECMEEDVEEVGDDQKIFILRCLLFELHDRIIRSEENLKNTFDIDVTVGEGQVKIR
ncbi:MAG: hypothetical protein RLZZ480_34 [Candidatus Parcubacteria bacterium]|jgi:hypothetical protein